MAGGRMRRVDEAVREVLSDAISKDLKDPRVGFVTVTAVKTSPDLRHARVYVSVLGDEPAREATLAGLSSAHGFLQGVIASELSLKHTPALTFEHDDTAARAARLNELMKDDTARPAVDDPARAGPDATTRADRDDDPDA
jgi:ribosome-binding factor A